MKVQIFDTSGQERYRAVTASYYKKTDAIILVYDITEKETFHNVSAWLQDIYGKADKAVCKLIVGNKCDLLEERVVSKEEAIYFADNLGLAFVETSAKSSENVETFFVGMIRELVRQADERGYEIPQQEEDTIKLMSSRVRDCFRERCSRC